MFKVDTERIRYYADELNNLAEDKFVGKKKERGNSQGPAIEAIASALETMNALENAFWDLVSQTSVFMNTVANDFDKSDSTESGKI